MAVNIAQASSGVNRATTVLRRGANIVTKACLWGIPHSSGAVGLSIKLGRYNYRQALDDEGFAEWVESLENENPKSELTLTEDEASKFLSFLSEQAGLVVTTPGEYIPAPAGNAKEVFEQILKLINCVDPQEMEELKSSGLLQLPKEFSDIVALANRQEAVRALEHLMAENADEADFQRWFKANPWVLGSDFVAILDKRDVSFSHQVDYIAENYDGHADVIELKRPGYSFWEKDLDKGNLVPHRDLTKAVTQLNAYLFDLERKIDSKEMAVRLNGVPIARPKGLLIYGLTSGWSESEFHAQRLLKSSFANLDVITFDQVLKRASRLTGGEVAH